MKTLTKYLALLVIAFLLSNCSSTNPFMKEGTQEYQKATAKMIGNWNVTEFKNDGKNLIGSKYEKITADFVFPNRTVTFEILVAKSTLKNKLIDWKKEYPNIKVDEYKIKFTANWDVADDIFVYFNEPKYELIINGTGENFDGFVAWEKTKFEAANSVDDGSLLGGALGSLAKSATGTSDLFPEFGRSYKYKIFTDKPGFSLNDDDNVIVCEK